MKYAQFTSESSLLRKNHKEHSRCCSLLNNTSKYSYFFGDITLMKCTRKKLNSVHCQSFLVPYSVKHSSLRNAADRSWLERMLTNIPDVFLFKIPIFPKRLRYKIYLNFRKQKWTLNTRFVAKKLTNKRKLRRITNWQTSWLGLTEESVCCFT